MKIAVYPGSFDPVTNGHIDVIERASKIFDNLIITVGDNPGKEPLFSREERVEMIREVTKGLKNVTVEDFEGLLLDYLKKKESKIIIRGLRAVSDFEFEFQMALMNRELDKACETFFLMPSPEYSFTRFRMIKEIAKYGGDISAFVPHEVMDALKRKKY